MQHWQLSIVGRCSKVMDVQKPMGGPGWCGLVEHCPRHPEVTGSIPSQGVCSIPSMELAGDSQWMFLSSMFLSFPLPNQENIYIFKSLWGLGAWQGQGLRGSHCD